MPFEHLPELDTIDSVDDVSVRFYAIIGACISLVAGVEHDLFERYLEASGVGAKEAAQVYYGKARFNHHLDLADAAIRAALARNPLLDKWEKLLLRVQKLAGPQAARNLLGHNSVTSELVIVPTPEGADVFQDFQVLQNDNQILAGYRKPRRETLSSLFVYARQLTTLRINLNKFGLLLREACEEYRPSDVAALAAIRNPARTRKKSRP